MALLVQQIHYDKQNKMAWPVGYQNSSCWHELFRLEEQLFLYLIKKKTRSLILDKFQTPLESIVQFCQCTFVFVVGHRKVGVFFLVVVFFLFVVVVFCWFVCLFFFVFVLFLFLFCFFFVYLFVCLFFGGHIYFDI